VVETVSVYVAIVFLYFVHHPMFSQKHNVSETGSVSVFSDWGQLFLRDSTEWGATFLPEDWNRSSFRNVFLRKHWTMDKVQEHESLKFYLNAWILYCMFCDTSFIKSLNLFSIFSRPVGQYLSSGINFLTSSLKQNHGWCRMRTMQRLSQGILTHRFSITIGRSLSTWWVLYFVFRNNFSDIVFFM
jgi:hypothetical protein